MELPAAVFRIKANEDLEEQITKNKNEYKDILIFPEINNDLVLQLQFPGLFTVNLSTENPFVFPNGCCNQKKFVLLIIFTK